MDKNLKEKSLFYYLLQAPVIVAALGYFVDIYDLLLFSIVRVPSLKALGFEGAALLDKGVLLINIQMAGLVVGGIYWGILGDKKGRRSVLFGSIFIYSAANFLNGFVTNIEQYALLRFIAGVGLAGELGAGVTLVAEILPKKIRGYGTTLIASVGLLGAVMAYFVAKYFDWHIAYMIGGGLGLCLLLLRVGVSESSIYKTVRQQVDINKGNFLSLFTNKKRFFKYLRCILIGLPVWFAIGILVTFSPEISNIMGIKGVEAGKAVMCCYIGLSLGDLGSGLLSQLLKSRKRAIAFFLLLSIVSFCTYLTIPATPGWLYATCGLIGFSVGYWAMFVTIAAEQFGTNLRSTVASTVPNFIRGSVVPLTMLFLYIARHWGLVTSAWILGGLCLVTAFTALFFMEETFHRDLDFVETDQPASSQVNEPANAMVY